MENKSEESQESEDNSAEVALEILELFQDVMNRTAERAKQIVRKQE